MFRHAAPKKFTSVYVNCAAASRIICARHRVVRLSMMRAQAVARELEKLGVPRDILYRQGFGSQDPLVPSPLQDPQNRRVEMFIRPE
jgi:outer membrane protein OmpA-like peptidoglycan-associated protein